jgi:hypothetical protein
LKLETKPKMPGLDGRVPQAGPAQRLGFHAKDKLLRLEGPAKGSAAESLSAAQAARWRAAHEPHPAPRQLAARPANISRTLAAHSSHAAYRRG